MMAIPGWILFGLIVGALARLLMPGKGPGGTAVLGDVLSLFIYCQAVRRTV